jgi:hypothetical protein
VFLCVILLHLLELLLILVHPLLFTLLCQAEAEAALKVLLVALTLAEQAEAVVVYLWVGLLQQLL